MGFSNEQLTEIREIVEDTVREVIREELEKYEKALVVLDSIRVFNSKALFWFIAGASAGLVGLYDIVMKVSGFIRSLFVIK